MATTYTTDKSYIPMASGAPMSSISSTAMIFRENFEEEEKKKEDPG